MTPDEALRWHGVGRRLGPFFRMLDTAPTAGHSGDPEAYERAVEELETIRAQGSGTPGWVARSGGKVVGRGATPEAALSVALKAGHVSVHLERADA
ncbi:hypothetical protein [Thermomonospora cellulosilytica]|uniref:Uncharacterized protein n=1 Tax=Thermomonospora cellulosilytica TaxID=1411118 RepID=A0A7W3R8J9_9ACTN|nr:hypothetical protein [Thermomonospora cellulosilytica]MBA9003644.1 hypothetical protein [Thermomonospora cellulosilytica]